MTVLSNTSIIAALDSGRLHIEPRPSPAPGVADTAYNTSSVDLRLADEIRVPRLGLCLEFDLRAGSIAETLDAVYDSRSLPPDGWSLAPGSFILARTIER